jgi:signal transduction histidine kinase
MKSEQAYIEMLLQDFRDRAGDDSEFQADVEEMADSIEQIKVQIDRCARITHSILSFGRMSDVEVQNVDLGKFIPEVLRMIQKKVELSDIDLRVDIGTSRLVVEVDPGRLQQVLLNLLNNAVHAASEQAAGRRGEILVTCAAEGSDRVRISIKDNGQGISSENQKLIFTPFFTTKPAGIGTGLGLSVCHGLIDTMKGVLDFASTPGQGATFFIVLPRVPLPPA